MKKNTVLIIVIVVVCLAVPASAGILLWQKDILKQQFAQIDFSGIFPFSGQSGGKSTWLTAELTPPVGVMIENELMARPFQSGLSEADIVYEAPTEGHITRFFAVFSPTKMPEKLGPVRSARIYFLDWMHEYNSLYAHVGGKFDALARLRKENILNIDQFVFDKYFWRENTGRTAFEHTVFTSGERLKKLIADQKWTWDMPAHLLMPQEPWNPAESSPAAAKISIDFGAPTYRVEYEYDPQTNKYLRLQAKKTHIDAGNKQQIAPAVIVVQKVKSWSNNDAAGSISIKTIGEGDAYIFKDGKTAKTKWKKDGLKAPTEFFDENDKKIVLTDLSNGPVWFEILPEQNGFKYE